MREKDVLRCRDVFPDSEEPTHVRSRLRVRAAKGCDQSGVVLGL